MLNNFINKITAETKSDPEVIKFGIFTLSQFLLGYLLLLIIAYIFNVFSETLIISIIFTLLRVFSGGAHANSPLNCLVLGSIIFVILGKITQYVFLNISPNYYLLVILSFILSIVSIFKYGYSTTHNKDLKSYKHGKKLLTIAIILVIIWFIFSILILIFNLNYKFLLLSSCCGVVWHSISLLPLSFLIINKLDKLLNKINILKGLKI